MCCRYFTEAELADTERVVDVNVIGTVRMTHMVTSYSMAAICGLYTHLTPLHHPIIRSSLAC